MNKTPKKTFEIIPFGITPDVTVCIDHASLLRYRYLVAQVSPNEVQWYAKVKRTVTPASERSRQYSNSLWTYHITDMFVPEQSVSKGSVDTDIKQNPAAMYRLMKEIEGRYPDDSSELGFNTEKANEDIQAMHVWCHSHPFTQYPTPSGQDDKMFSDWVYDNQIAQTITSPFVALIFGSSENIHARIYDPLTPGIMYENVKVSITVDKDFDTTYMDNAVATKIEEKTFNYASGGTYIRCSDGVYRTSEVKNAFDKTNQKKLISKKNKCFFDKYFPTDWETFVADCNSKYDNTKEIMELWNFMCRWLPTKLERTLFCLALVDTSESLEKMARAKQEDLFHISDEDAILVLTTHFSSDSVCSKQLRSALTFSKRYAKQNSEEGRLRAVRFLKKSLDKIIHNSASPSGYVFLEDCN